MILDKQCKVFGKVNVLDLLVVVFIVIFCGIIAFKFVSSDAQKKLAHQMKVVVYADDIQPDVAEKMKDNKEVYFGRGQVKTNVDNVEILPMPTGSKRPDFKEVRITLSGDGYLYGDGAYFENQRVSLDKKVWLRSIYEIEATVMDIK